MSGGKPRILIAEPTAPVAAALRKFLDGIADVGVGLGPNEALAQAKGAKPDLVIASVTPTFDGEGLAAQLRDVVPGLSVVFLYAPEEERALERCARAKGDGLLVGPIKRTVVLATLKNVLRVAELERLNKDLAEKLEKAKAAPPPPPPPRAPSPGVNAHDETFFKKYMLLEVKRSRRYQYPVALLIVGIDGLAAKLPKDASGDKVQAQVQAEGLTLLSAMLRDVDVALPFADDRFLLFLPHTPRAGSVIVAERAAKKLAEITTLTGLTASVGVASYDPKLTPKGQVSFGSLVKDATIALKKAQDEGGNRVEAGEAPAAPKRDRISLG